jgi:hypothetical protein
MLRDRLLACEGNRGPAPVTVYLGTGRGAAAPQARADTANQGRGLEATPFRDRYQHRPARPNGSPPRYQVPMPRPSHTVELGAFKSMMNQQSWVPSAWADITRSRPVSP